MAIYHIGKYTGNIYTLKRAGNGHIGLSYTYHICPHYKACEDFPYEPPKLSAIIKSTIKCSIFVIFAYFH